MHPHIALSYVAAVQQNVGGGRQRSPNAGQLRGIPSKAAVVEQPIAQIQRALAAMRNHMNGVDAASTIQIACHLIEPIRITLEDVNVIRRSQAVNQRLVVGDAGINEDDAVG